MKTEKNQQEIDKIKASGKPMTAREGWISRLRLATI